jgi:hypothetical protein
MYVQVAWDEAAPSERRTRVSLWDIEPVIAPFFIYPTPLFTAKRARQPGMIGNDGTAVPLFVMSITCYLHCITKNSRLLADSYIVSPLLHNSVFVIIIKLYPQMTRLLKWIIFLRGPCHGLVRRFAGKI